MRVPIIVPEAAYPKKDPEHPCPCQDKQVHLTFKTCLLMWLTELGESVTEGQAVCEGEVEKKALEFTAPVSGVLVERCLEDDDEFSAGDILGYIETEAVS